MPFGFFFLNPKKKTDKVQEWLKLQSYYEDAVYYLIEKEIYENGMRDLSYLIPRLRNEQYFESIAFQNKRTASDVELEYNPRLVMQAPNKLGHERLSAVPLEVQKPIIPEPFTAFKASSSPVVVAPASATDLSLIDTACFDD